MFYAAAALTFYMLPSGYIANHFIFLLMEYNHAKKKLK
jgi:hypothetical protein